MKKVLLMAIGLIAYVGVYAQKDANAVKILDKVSANYHSFQSISANFVIEIENLTDKSTTEQSGSIVLKKKKYVLKMDGQEIISNGNDVWTYLKDINEVQIDVVSYDEESISPVNFFTLYEKGFKYIYVGEEEKAGIMYHRIDLVPEDDSRSFFKVQLYVDIANNLITGAKIFDKGGMHYYYTINNFKSNVMAEDSKFEFNPNKYTGIEVIDLR